MKAYDADKSGKVSETELINATSRLNGRTLTNSEKDELKDFFGALDTDNNG